MAEPWAVLVREGHQALLEGRFRACARLAAEAAQLAPGDLAPGLLTVAACREQGRAAEAELLARDLVAAHPEAPEAHALLGAVLADLGRDAEARRQLDRVEGADPLVVAALAAEIAAVLHLAGPAEALHGRLASHAGEVLATTGALARHVALLCQVLGRWDEAEANFEAALQANAAAGAPVLLAHTRRQYSALLRVRGDEGDWERAIELLHEAAVVYRRLQIDRLAEESEAVLRRSQEVGSDPAGGGEPNLFRREPGGWELAYGGRAATVPDAPGLAHLAALLAADGRPVHVVDLASAAAGDPSEGLGGQLLAEYKRRGRALDAELAGPVDPAAAALARAELDLLVAESPVAGSDPTALDVGECARRLVVLRIRVALDGMEAAHPALARHLRRGIRTGTFCLYDPERPERWRVTQ